MTILALAGTSSGSGKTTLGCLLAAELPGWGALKVSPVHGAISHGLAGEYEIRTSMTFLSARGSDTARYLAAGAFPVAWVVSRRESIAAAMADALSRFSRSPGVLVEGTSAALALPQALVALMVAPGDWSPSARAVAPRARWIVEDPRPAVPRILRELTSGPRP